MSSEDDGGLDASAWERLRTVTLAANSGDRAKFEGEIKSWSSNISLGEQQRIGLYLFASVKHLVRLLLGGDPSVDDLMSFAARCVPCVERVLIAHSMALEDALRRAFDMPFIRRKLTPGELLLLNAAIVGCLLTKPEAELREMREYVAEWWRVNAREIHEHGVQDK